MAIFNSYVKLPEGMHDSCLMIADNIPIVLPWKIVWFGVTPSMDVALQNHQKGP